MIAPAVGPSGEEIWPAASPVKQEKTDGVNPGEEALGAEEEHSGGDDGNQLDDECMSAATSDACPHAAGPDVRGEVVGPLSGVMGGQTEFWDAAGMRIGNKIEGVERLPSVLSSSLAEISSSQREMMQHLSSLTRQVREEAAFQRDVQRVVVQARCPLRKRRWAWTGASWAGQEARAEAGATNAGRTSSATKNPGTECPAEELSSGRCKGGCNATEDQPEEEGRHTEWQQTGHGRLGRRERGSEGHHSEQVA